MRTVCWTSKTKTRVEFATKKGLREGLDVSKGTKHKEYIVNSNSDRYTLIN